MDNKRNVTTKRQFGLLLEEIRKYPQLGRGAPKSTASKHQWDEQWEVLSAKLNSCGPPMRTTTHWKKIWSNLRAQTTRRLTENLTSTDKSRDPISPIHFSHQEEEIASALGLHEDLFEDQQEIVAIEKAEEISSDEESRVHCMPICEAPVFNEPRTAVSNIPQSSTAISAVSAAVFKAVSAAASAAASTIVSNADLNDITTSAATLTKTTASKMKQTKHKGHKDESVDLLRQQVSCQRDISESLNRIANAIEFHVERSRRRCKKEQALF